MSETTSVPAENIRWDLSCLYNGLDDPQLNADVHSWVDVVKEFYARFNGKLAEDLPEALRAFSFQSTLCGKIGFYLHLRKSINTGDAAVKAMIAEFDKIVSVAAATYLEFFQHELVEIDDAVITAHAVLDDYLE